MLTDVLQHIMLSMELAMNPDMAKSMGLEGGAEEMTKAMEGIGGQKALQ